MHILVQDGCHLRLLDGTHLARGKHNEHADVLLPPKSVDSRAAGISTRSPNDGQMLSLPLLSLLFASISPDQKELKQIP